MSGNARAGRPTAAKMAAAVGVTRSSPRRAPRSSNPLSSSRATAAGRGISPCPPRAGADPPNASGSDDEEVSPVIVVAKRASRFSREFIVTVISVVTTAFGVVVALAWNTALSKALEQLSRNAEVIGLFIYAVLITFMAVMAIIFLGRLATRMGAEPIQFALPAKKEED